MSWVATGGSPLDGQIDRWSGQYHAGMRFDVNADWTVL